MELRNSQRLRAGHEALRVKIQGVLLTALGEGKAESCTAQHTQ